MGLPRLLRRGSSCFCRFRGQIVKHLFKMKIFKDIISGDEMFTDANSYEDIDDAFLMVIGKHITLAADDIQLDGANPSAEGEGDEGADAGCASSGVDFVLTNRLMETGFGSKKDYLLYLKGYMKKLGAELDEEKKPKLKAIEKPIMEIMKKFKDLQFYTGESQDNDAIIGILDYKDINGEEVPVMYLPKYGLLEEKVKASL